MKENLFTISLITRLHFKQTFLEIWIWLHMLLQPLLIILLILFLAQDRQIYAIDIIIGGGMAGMWNTILSNCAWNLEGEKWLGTLEELIASPTHIGNVIIGKNLANILLSLFSFGLSFLYATLIIGNWIYIANPLGFIISLIFTTISFVSLSLLLASLFTLSTFIRGSYNALTYPIFILCGFFFPITILPFWITPISYIIPLYWSNVSLRLTITNTQTFSELVFSWLISLFWSIAALICAKFFFDIFLQRVRKTAAYERM